MVDRHNAGQPVLSGPAALGLEEKSDRKEQKKGTTITTTTTTTTSSTTSTGSAKSATHNGSGQLVQKPSGQVQKLSPASEGANL